MMFKREKGNLYEIYPLSPLGCKLLLAGSVGNATTLPVPTGRSMHAWAMVHAAAGVVLCMATTLLRAARCASRRRSRSVG
jgi:hypothetical protein